MKLFFRNRLLLGILSLIAISLPAYMKAEVVITDALTGIPLSKASVFDKFGIFLGVTDDKGVVSPSIPTQSYPLNIRYVGYQPQDVASPEVGIVKMQESVYDLPEIVVDDVSRNLLYLTVFVRDYTTVEDVVDTLGYYSEQIVDYVIPLTKKTKFKGWKKPRILASKQYNKIKRDKKKESIDTLIYSTSPQKYSPQFSITDKFVVPQPILTGEATEYQIDGKYGIQEKWYAIGDNYIIEKDELADDKDHIFQPAFLKLLGASAAQTVNEARYKFEKNTNGASLEKLVEASNIWDLILKGKIFKKATGQNDDIRFNSYSEMYVIDRAYLTSEEAKDLKQNPPVISSSFKEPDGIPAPPAEVQKLKLEVMEKNQSSNQ